jgi:hypothetical protein
MISVESALRIWRDRGFVMGEELTGEAADKALRRKIALLRIMRLTLMVLGIALIVHGVTTRGATFEILLAMVALTAIYLLNRVQIRLRPGKGKVM